MHDPSLTPITLESLGSGGAVELFEREFTRVLDNIADVNCEAKAPRKVTLEVTIKPTEDRASGRIAVKVSSVLAGTKPLVSTVFMGKKDGQFVAVAMDPRQSNLFGGGEADVLPISGKKGGTK